MTNSESDEEKYNKKSQKKSWDNKKRYYSKKKSSHGSRKISSNKKNYHQNNKNNYHNNRNNRNNRYNRNNQYLDNRDNYMDKTYYLDNNRINHYKNNRYHYKNNRYNHYKNNRYNHYKNDRNKINEFSRNSDRFKRGKYKNIKINSSNNKENKKNVIIEVSKTIPIQNFPFKELLDNAFQKQLEVNKREDDDVESVESLVIDSDDEVEELNFDIKSIKDLICLGKMYNKKDKKNYAIDLKKLNNLIEPLEKLENAIGMENIKQTIIDQIIYILQKFDKEEEMLHTVIEGPPGVGKTMLGKILGEIYYNLGIIKKKKIDKPNTTNNPLMSLFEPMEQYKKKENKDHNQKFPFKVVRRSDLIGQYLGHTAQKTQDAIDEANGGVLFIDEAYSLGSEDLKDSYAKECIDTINQNLSENKGHFVCIIAGYPFELEKYFFSQNRGLERRFVFRYKIEKYTPEELYQILLSKIEKSKWKLDSKFDNHKTDLTKLIKNNIKKFSNFGGDIETLFLKCKISHSNRVFGKHPKFRKKLTLHDFEKGVELFLQNKKKDDDKPLNMMYT